MVQRVFVCGILSGVFPSCLPFFNMWPRATDASSTMAPQHHRDAGSGFTLPAFFSSPLTTVVLPPNLNMVLDGSLELTFTEPLPVIGFRLKSVCTSLTLLLCVCVSYHQAAIGSHSALVVTARTARAGP